MKLLSLIVVIVALAVGASARERKLFPATLDSVAAENRRADTLGLKQYETPRDIERGVEAGVLVPLTGEVSPRLARDRRYALPSTVAYVTALNAEFNAVTGGHLVLDSAVRDAVTQRRLRRWNRCAAPATGERASSHERGTTFDLARRMSKAQYRWLLWHLFVERERGRILVIEERRCLHVFVGGTDE